MQAPRFSVIVPGWPIGLKLNGRDLGRLILKELRTEKTQRYKNVCHIFCIICLQLIHLFVLLKTKYLKL